MTIYCAIFDANQMVFDHYYSIDKDDGNLHCKRHGRLYSIIVHTAEKSFNVSMSSYVAPHELALNIDSIYDDFDMERFVIQFATMVAELNNWQ